jgi:hypothetical protein
VKSAHLTRESECSSLQWPTTAARDYKGTSPGYLFRADGKSRVDQLAVAVDQAEIGNWPTPTVQEAGKIGNQANHGQMGLSNHPAIRGEVQREKYDKSMHGQAITANWLTPATVQIQRQDMQKRIDYRASIGRQYVPGSLEEQMQTHGQVALVNPSTNGSRQESWATPRTGATDSTRPNNKGGIPLGDQVQRESAWATPSTMDHINVIRKPEERSHAANKGGCKNLREEVHQWPTICAGDYRTPPTNSGIAGQTIMPSSEHALPKAAGGKLNPRWVETLMGLPIGWTMPSCQSPVTIEPMNCDYSETESSQPQQSEHSELF